MSMSYLAAWLLLIGVLLTWVAVPVGLLRLVIKTCPHCRLTMPRRATTCWHCCKAAKG